MTSPSRRSFLGLATAVGGLALGPAAVSQATLHSGATGPPGALRGARRKTTAPLKPHASHFAFLVGADNNEGFGNNTLSAFQDAAGLIGPLKMRRSFPALSSWGSTVAADEAAGYRSFVSATVPNQDYAGVAAGNYDRQIAAAVTSLPAWTRVTMNHEPENDVAGATFVEMFRRFYTVVKTTNPGVMVGPTHLTYGWRHPNGVGACGNNHGLESEAQWDVGDDYRDFTAADTYSVQGQPLQSDPQFRHWFDFFSGVSVKPLAIAEYGQYAVPPGGSRSSKAESKRASLITQDATWLSAQPQFRAFWLVWNGSGAQGNWKLQDKASIDAWRAVASKGRGSKATLNRASG